MSEQATEGGSVRVVGTAHVSARSVDEVESVIDEEDPDAVAVELDEGRFRQLKGEHPDDLDAGDLLKGNTVYQFLAYWMLSYIQTRLGEEFDIEPGADMMAAVDAAEEQGTDIALVDRDIQVTIQRFWARLSTLEKLRLVGGLALDVTDALTLGLSVGMSVGVFVAILGEMVAGPFVLTGGLVPGFLVGLLDGIIVAGAITVVLGGAISLLSYILHDPEEVEEIEEFNMSELTDVDVVTAMMEEFRRFSPGGAEALIDERDAYIAHKLVSLRESGRHVVAVVGAGHQAGIERYLDRPETLPPQESLVGHQKSGRFSLYKVIGYLITISILAFFILVAMAGVQSTFLLKLFGAWFLITGISTFVFSRLAGAHWTSAAAGGGVAWMTILNPVLASGWFAGYVELRYTSVNVKDISRLNEILSDEESPLRDLFARMRQVPLFKLMFVVFMTNVGSGIGIAIFGFVVPSIVSNVMIGQLMLEGAQNSIDLILERVL
jgi:pheromone shutdown-related protein TraB